MSSLPASPSTQPDRPKSPDRIVLFDGVCKLCNAWARFLIKYDTRYVFKLASVQSDEGRALLSRFGFPLDDFSTMLLVEDDKIYQRSTAFIRVVARLPWPWKLAAIFWIIPRFIRNWLYDRIALNRYKLFGKYSTCVLPSADDENRYWREPKK